MTNNKSDLLVLTLLLINKGEPLNNSYELMRILEWKFHIIESKKILDQIKDYYAQYEIVNGVHYYKLGLEGRELIKQEYNTALESLLQDYPQEVSIITSLFNSFSTDRVQD